MDFTFSLQILVAPQMWGSGPSGSTQLEMPFSGPVPLLGSLMGNQKKWGKGVVGHELDHDWPCYSQHHFSETGKGGVSKRTER